MTTPPQLSASKAKEILVRTSKNGKVNVTRKFFPFYVRLNVMDSPTDIINEGVFIYAHNESHAAPLACVLWAKWRRSDTIITDYPKLGEGTEFPVVVVAIDDEDYAYYLKESTKLPRYTEGNPADPPAFMVKGREIFGVSESRKNKNI
jgi:hypothetical protein